jgi:hypothetical protein
MKDIRRELHALAHLDGRAGEQDEAQVLVGAGIDLTAKVQFRATQQVDFGAVAGQPGAHDGIAERAAAELQLQVGQFRQLLDLEVRGVDTGIERHQHPAVMAFTLEITARAEVTSASPPVLASGLISELARQILRRDWAGTNSPVAGVNQAAILAVCRLNMIYCRILITEEDSGDARTNQTGDRRTASRGSA